MNIYKTLILSACAIAVCACNGSRDNKDEKRIEDFQAKKMLQGIWVDSDEENVVFKVKGDTIYYPDTLSQPIRFAIYGDTLEMQSSNIPKYAIVKQTEHIFEFKNANGDLIKLVKGNDPSYELQFAKKTTVAVNQNTTIKSDSTVNCGDGAYHSYVQVNPTTYKVYKTSYNNDGLEVENIYFDNTVHVGIFKQGVRIFSKNFRKNDFKNIAPNDFLKQSVLSDIILKSGTNDGLLYTAQLAIPDSYVSYMVDLKISTKGKVTMSLQK